MPSAVSNQNNYYAAHHRRQSSQSHSNLPDQIRSPVQVTSPNRSLVFLPSSAYTQPQPQQPQSPQSPQSQLQFKSPGPRSRTPSLTIVSRTNSRPEPPKTDDPPADPHDFYRQYQDQFGHHSPGAGLHSEAIRTTSVDEDEEATPAVRKASVTSTEDERVGRTGRRSISNHPHALNTKPPVNGRNGARSVSSGVPTALRSRKASFKDLVARFDASPDEVPPLPTQQLSRPSSRTASPRGYPAVTLGLPHPKRPASRTSDVHVKSALALTAGGVSAFSGGANNRAVETKPAAMFSKRASNAESQPSLQRPLLFGEVLPSTSSVPAAGYGITNARRRRGSEGSSMHSPNPMFPSSDDAFRSHLPSKSAGKHPPPSPSQHRHAEIENRTLHRRANSDFSGPRPVVQRGRDTSISPHDQAYSDVAAGQSRIPISSRHQRMASDSAAISPATARPPGSQLPLRTQDFAKTSSNQGTKATSPRRRPHSPIQIKSPGRRGFSPSVNTSEKSPSLRANIIVPPEKVSPRLRSSRPRQPVSSASTAASRAKIAEKFAASAKQQSDKKAVRRQRPPELTDIDLKARRLRITQALSKSREGQDLKGGPVERPTSSISHATSATTPSVGGSEKAEDMRDQTEIPTVVVDRPMGEDTEERDFYHPQEDPVQDQRALTQDALRIIEDAPSQTIKDMDSPTLGHERPFGAIPYTLNTNLLRERDNADPLSALTEGTVATEATIIEPEPQTEATRLQSPGNSLADQISTIRSHSSNSPTSATSQQPDDQSDHADEISVNLMYRGTTYLDDDEAREKGYRPLAPNLETDPLPERKETPGRDSWTSSIDGEEEPERQYTPLPAVAYSPHRNQDPVRPPPMSRSTSNDSEQQDESFRDTMASDAYTIVNIVLQQQTPSGVVDQQLVDDIYHRIIQSAPGLADAENVDEAKVQSLCLQELEEYHNRWSQAESPVLASSDKVAADEQQEDAGEVTQSNKQGTFHSEPDSLLTRSITKDDPLPPPPPSSFKSHHRYKSSLDSAEDFAETSPSIGDWLQFGLRSAKETEHIQRRSVLSYESLPDTAPDAPTPSTGLGYTDADAVTKDIHIQQSVAAGGADILRPPSHSPPPPPIARMPSFGQAAWSAPAGTPSSLERTPSFPRPQTGVSYASARSSIEKHARPPSTSTGRPSTEGELNPEQRRVNKRKHVLKELVDTEYSYERDMKVLCDIYKATAVDVLVDEDVKIIFGNVEQVQQFAKDFLSLLKQVVKPAYVMDRKKDGNRASTVDTNSISDATADMTDAQKDEYTRVGQAFEASTVNMEKVYTDFIRTRHAANKRLEALQSSLGVKEWLKECSDNSSDITNAWSLDALLVKPIQRITKYPLLLQQLIESTPQTHPDILFLQKAVADVIEVNVRINEVKKHTEIVDQVLNRKRKESDVRNGLTKAIGRRAEKLRQHVGINEMYEDAEYSRLKINYDNNIAHIFLVSKDCQGYVDAIKLTVGRLCEIAAAAEGWVDVGHTRHPQMESKLRQFAIVVRGVNSIALPDHIDQIARRIVAPMEKTASMLEKFKADPKGLIQKREKRLLDYNQYKNKRDRGEKLDKKSTERMEQWEALNLEAKERMRRLLQSTADLVLSCQAVLVEIHIQWLAMCKAKFSSAIGLSIDAIDQMDIVKDWQEDYDFQEASALSLGICNGSLLAEAVNMMSFLSAGTTLASDESPRQPSWNSGGGAPRSSSSVGLGRFDGTSSTIVPFENGSIVGPSGSQGGDDGSDRLSFAQGNGRVRAPSAASGRLPKTPEARGTPSIQTANTGSASRPGTRSGYYDDGPPRISLDAPSPSFNLMTESPQMVRHMSTSTFYSAAPSHSQPNLPGGYDSRISQYPPPPPAPAPLPATTQGSSNIFSSAMPMSDGSEPNGHDEFDEARRETTVLYTAASIYEFNIDRARQQGGFRYLTYVTGEIFDVIAEHGELWLAINQDDPTREIGWIWNKHFAKLEVPQA